MAVPVSKGKLGLFIINLARGKIQHFFVCEASIWQIKNINYLVTFEEHRVVRHYIYHVHIYVYIYTVHINIYI